MAVTIRDVARKAQVSIASVSYVINNGPRNVSKETREKVEKAIKETGYSPNSVARSLKTSRTYNIGLLVTDLQDLFFTDLIGGVQYEALQHNYNVFLCSSENDPERELHYVRQLEAQNVNGVLIAGSRLDKETLNGIASKMKAVILSPHKINNATQFYLDDYEGGRLAGELFYSLGHRNIKFIDGSWMNGISHRLDGLADFMRNKGLDTSSLANINVTDLTFENGFKATERTLKSFPDTTAIFCYNDEIAAGAISACRHLGYSVPHDISIIGFDNTKISRMTSPSLTTIDSNAREIGINMTRALISMLEGNLREPRFIKLPLRLINRESTDSVRKN